MPSIPGHGWACALLADVLEDLLEVGDVLLGLLLVRSERARELGVGRLLCELGKRRRERLLRVVHVLELVLEELSGVVTFGIVPPWVMA